MFGHRKHVWSPQLANNFATVWLFYLAKVQSKVQTVQSKVQTELADFV